ncbi:MAG: septum formation initiator family protein [Candidatus Pacebacteria bacterium]|nr:septum formation initiator family protein [Candidatus Paceibacterota bacterium]
MKDYRTRKQRKNPFYHSWVFLFVLVLVLGLFVRSAYASFSKKRTADLEREKYQTRFDELVEKKELLEEKIEHLKTERGIEEELRKRFNVTKEGEKIIKIIE